MSARDEAIEAMREQFTNWAAPDCRNDDANHMASDMLDAIPPAVKARLAIDEGGLRETGVTRDGIPYDTETLEDQDHPWPTLYRLIDLAEEADR